MYQTFAHQINRVKTLLDGLNAYGERVSELGITPELVSKLADLYNQANQLEQKRNDLKASSREATTAQEQTMSELNHKCSLARKSIRVALPEENWPAFGFKASRPKGKESSQTPAAETGANINLSSNI
jgi:vacuolar-type H+-ATPase subunit I/STV1